MRYQLKTKMVLWFSFFLCLKTLSAASSVFRPVDANINFRHQPGNSGQRYIVETISSGCAFLDYDNDGWLDLYLVNGHSLPANVSSTAIALGNQLESNALYHSNGDGTFINRTKHAGIGDTGYGIGCCTGDFNNDGWIDLYVTNFKENVLYQNNGDGTFSDMTQEAGVDCPSWSASCAFIDYDRDGNLDLYVVNYLDFRLADHKICGNALRPDCGPSAYPCAADTLYQNNGNGTFTDVTEQVGVFNPNGKGLGIACGDYDNDGNTDIYIANDDTRNFLYRNNGDGTFTDLAFFAGVGFSEDGEVQGGMGTSFGDYDNDGLLDLIVTNYQDQINTLYHNDGNGLFSDVSHTTGTGPDSLPMVGWGAGFLDYDNDGWLDLFVANGHLLTNIEQFDTTSTYYQPNFLYHNQHDGSFDRIEIGLEPVRSSRGSAFGDFDNDGDIDVLTSNTDDQPILLENKTGQDRNWIGLKLVGTKSNRSAIGTRVEVTAGGRSQSREVTGGSSYASANDLRLLFGIGELTVADEITIHWPTGRVESRSNVRAGQYLTVIEE